MSEYNGLTLQEINAVAQTAFARGKGEGYNEGLLAREQQAIRDEKELLDNYRHKIILVENITREFINNTRVKKSKADLVYIASQLSKLKSDIETALTALDNAT